MFDLLKNYREDNQEEEDVEEDVEEVKNNHASKSTQSETANRTESEKKTSPSAEREAKSDQKSSSESTNDERGGTSPSAGAHSPQGGTSTNGEQGAETPGEEERSMDTDETPTPSNRWAREYPNVHPYQQRTRTGRFPQEPTAINQITEEFTSQPIVNLARKRTQAARKKDKQKLGIRTSNNNNNNKQSSKRLLRAPGTSSSWMVSSKQQMNRAHPEAIEDLEAATRIRRRPGYLFRTCTLLGASVIGYALMM